MIRRRKSLVLTVALLCIVSLLAACGQQADPAPTDPSEPTPREPMEVVVGTGTNPSSLSTWTGTGVPEKDICNLIAWPLIMWDDNLEFEMVLAKDMHFPDDLTIVFELHEGLLFHDGVEMTAEDVKYTFDTMSDPDAREGRGYINQSFYRPIEEIVVTDRYTVEFRLNTPHAPLLYYLAEGIMPKHIGEEHGDTYLEQNPIGVAPFKLETWVPQEYISIVACDNFYLGRPQIDRIVFRQIEDMHTRVIELETGGVHAISGIAHEHVQGLVDNPDITVEMKPVPVTPICCIISGVLHSMIPVFVKP